jgi:hypothetical protein
MLSTSGIGWEDVRGWLVVSSALLVPGGCKKRRWLRRDGTWGGIASGAVIRLFFRDASAGRRLAVRLTLVKVLDVTDEQRSRRPIFNATLRAAARWLFFRVARLTV